MDYWMTVHSLDWTIGTRCKNPVGASKRYRKEKPIIVCSVFTSWRLLVMSRKERRRKLWLSPYKRRGDAIICCRVVTSWRLLAESQKGARRRCDLKPHTFPDGGVFRDGPPIFICEFSHSEPRISPSIPKAPPPDHLINRVKYPKIEWLAATMH